jgi:hypothetical protein
LGTLDFDFSFVPAVFAGEVPGSFKDASGPSLKSEFDRVLRLEEEASRAEEDWFPPGLLSRETLREFPRPAGEVPG